MSSTTLKDYGRTSAEHGEIPFYYAFEFKFWFRKSQIAPNDVYTWCRDNCTGYYKVVCYTHEDSTRKKYSRTNEFDEKIVYVDKIYLSSAEDATAIRMIFDVSDEQITRMEKLKRKTRRKSKK